jgi:CRP/FNR family transcriptional regulator, cyclic AMP receptor protein
MLHRFEGSHNRRNLIDALRGQKILRASPAAADKIADQGVLQEFQPKDVVIQCAAPDTDVHLILAGSVDIVVNGHSYTTRLRGEHIGEMALIDPGQKRCATVYAREVTVVCRVNEALFIALAEEHPDMWRQVAVELAERLRQRNKLMRQKNPQALIFVGSSSEGMPLAQAVADELNLPGQIRFWNENVFQPSEHTMESLERQLDESDFAILVLTPDDIVESRSMEKPAPRDNLILELGLFMGRIGRRRTLAIIPKGSGLKVPSDLFGINLIPHDLAAAKQVAFQETAKKIHSVIDRLGCRGL